MIELTPLARPYAKALFSAAVESNTIDEMAVDLKIMAMASKTEEVINTIENPVLSRQDVISILSNLFEASVSDTSKKLIEILAENKRTKYIEFKELQPYIMNRTRRGKKIEQKFIHKNMKLNYNIG